MSATDFGRFEGNVVAVWLPDGRDMRLVQPFAYINSDGKRWEAPIESTVNGASIPPSLWSVVGGPYEGQYRNASVVHDVYCETMSEPWEDVHEMFYEACRCGGVTERKAKMMYYAVYHFGPRWDIPETTDGMERAPLRKFGAGPTALEAAQPVAVDQQAMRQVMEYINDQNPSLATLRKLSPDQAQETALLRAAPKKRAPKKKTGKKRAK